VSETVKRHFDGIMLEFPLCCLCYPIENKEKVSMIISYCIVEHSKKIEININQRVKEYPKEKLPFGFDKTSKAHCRILLAAEELGVKLGDIYDTYDQHEKLQKHISNFIIKHGKDAYCRIGKDLLFDVYKNGFPYRQFAVLCGIQSVVGKKPLFKRVTKDRIRYTMLGYKSKTVALAEMDKGQMLLTDRQLGSTIQILHAKEFFSKFTYAKRQSFYSTRLNNKELYDAVEKSKIYWAKKKMHIEDKQVTEKIKSQLRIIKLPTNPAKYGNVS